MGSAAVMVRGAGLDSDGVVTAGRCARTCGSASPSGPRSSALLLTPVRTDGYHPDSFSLAVKQKIHHTLRIEAAGINPESNVRQAIEASLDDRLKLVDRPAVGCSLNSGGELRGLGVI